MFGPSHTHTDTCLVSVMLRVKTDRGSTVFHTTDSCSVQNTFGFPMEALKKPLVVVSLSLLLLLFPKVRNVCKLQV